MYSLIRLIIPSILSFTSLDVIHNNLPVFDLGRYYIWPINHKKSKDMKTLIALTITVLFFTENSMGQPKYASKETKNIIEKMVEAMEDMKNGKIWKRSVLLQLCIVNLWGLFAFGSILKPSI